MKQKDRSGKWNTIAGTRRFRLSQSAEDSSKFRVRLKKADGNYRVRHFVAVSEESAISEALAEFEPEPQGLAAQSVRLVEAFNEALQHSTRGAISAAAWRGYAYRFMLWLETNHPDCCYWHLLTRKIIREYLDLFGGKSATTRRLSLQPICQTSGYMHREHGFVNFAERLGLSSKIKTTPPVVYVTDVASFCDFLSERSPRLEVGAALQGLGGLQLQEATRLTWDKVDVERGLVEISGEVKNEYRNRLIPVCGRLKEALQRAADQRQERQKSGARPAGSHVLISRQGLPFGRWWCNYAKEIGEAMREWNPRIPWKPKDLRNCLPTFAVTQGLHNDLWEQYIGHAPRSVTATHYVPRLLAASHGERQEIDRRMDLFRKQVIEALDKAVTNGKDMADHHIPY